jgi:hypothetical protein
MVRTPTMPTSRWDPKERKGHQVASGYREERDGGKRRGGDSGLVHDELQTAEVPLGLLRSSNGEEMEAQLTVGKSGRRR